MDWGVFATGAVSATVVVVSLGFLWWMLHDSKQKKARGEENRLYWETSFALERAGVSLSEEYRYQIVVSDWGPDFTGQDGTLHRWRWVVSDADLGLRRVLGLEDPKGQDFLMLGNSPTGRLAYLEALAWIEKQKFPAQVVVP